MKKRYFSFIAIIMVLAMFILAAGCGVRINGKDYELFRVDDKDKNGILNGLGTEMSRDQELIEERQDSLHLTISNSVGEIEIKRSDVDSIKINAKKRVKGSSDETKNNILDNMNIKLERNDNEIKVVVKTKDGEDFWKWQSETLKVYSPSIDYEISIPEEFNELNVTSGVGDIRISNMTAELTVTTGVGEIKLKEVNALGDSAIKSGTGDITFEGNIDRVNSFDATTGVGEVSFKVPESTKMSLKANTGVGSLTGDFIKVSGDFKFKFSGDINGGGPSVNLKTGVGDVKADY